MQTFIRGVMVILLLALVTSVAETQTLTGSVSGKIRDEQGAVLPGVTVTLTGRMGSQQTVTDAAGEYRFPGLEPGVYVVVAEMSGFQPTRQENVAVSVGTSASVDIALKVAGLQESVTVLAESPIVDTKSSATDTKISQELLANAPITRTAINVLNYAPGINSSSAYGSDGGSANSLLIDGVDTRDPSGGTPWTFYNYNIVEEIQIQGLGASAEYGGFTGAVINTITKSGGNRFSGLFEALGTNDSMASSNINDEIIAKNPALREASKTTKYLDLTAQLGGPIKQNKAFFFVSAQRFLLEVDPSGPVTRRHETSPRLNFKVSLQPTNNDTFTGHLQYDAYNIIGRAGVPAASATDELTNREDAPEYVWLLNWRHLFGSNTFAEVKYTGWWGFYDLNPEVTASGHSDENGLFSVSQGWFYYADRERNQINGSVTHYADKFGRHEFKFGAELERSMTRDRYGYNNDIIFYDYGGAPYLGYNYGYDLTAHNERESLFVQDSWKVTDRVTFNVGLRGDFIRGTHPDLGKVFSTTSWSPRLGFAWDVTGDYRTVLKGSYGHYYEGAQTGAFTKAVPGIEDYVTYEVLPGWVVGDEIGRDESTPYRVADDLKHPRIDEATISLERALTGDMRLVVTGIWRDSTNFIGSVNPSARWRPVQATNTLTNQPITLYNWDNRDDSDTDFVIQNVAGFQFRDPAGNVIATLDPNRNYQALMLVLSKRYTNRWQAQASYVLSKAEGNVDNTSNQQISTSIFENPNRSIVNTDGRVTNDRTHEFKLLGSYSIPKVEVSVNAFFRAMSGRNYTPFAQYTSGLLNAPTASRQPFLEPRGSRRFPTDTTLDLRFEKNFNLGSRDRIGVFLEVLNSFNRDTITNVVTRVPSQEITYAPGQSQAVLFESPSAIIAPRQVQLAARWSF
jgi:Carboxypeptidase regulatory-like domain/TonB dependent receptor